MTSRRVSEYNPSCCENEAERSRDEPIQPKKNKHLWHPGALAPSVLVPFVWFFIGAVFFFFLAHTVADVDLWHEMALAREAIRLGYVPTEDLFAYTPTVSPSVHHEWGAGLLAYLFLSLAGESGILLLKYLVGLSLAGVILLRLRLSAPFLSTLVVTLPIGLILLQPGLGTIRAQMYSFLFTATLLLFLEYDRRGNRSWIVPWLGLFILWVNLHGGFVLAFLLLGAEWLQRTVTDQPRKHLAGVGIVMIAFIAANPYGLSLYSYIVQALLMDRPHIQEWDPIWAWFPRLPFHMLLFVLSTLILFYGVNRSWKLEGLFPLLFLLVASLFCFRMIFFYSISWLAVVPGYLKHTPIAEAFDRLWRRRAVFSAPLLVVLIVGFVQGTLQREPWKLVVPANPDPRFGEHIVYPVGAVDHLEKIRFEGNLMVPFQSGSYVLWRLFPRVRVSIDSRYEVAYPSWLIEEHFMLYTEGVGSAFERYFTDAVLVENSSPVAKSLNEELGWSRCYQDNYFSAFLRLHITN